MAQRPAQPRKSTKPGPHFIRVKAGSGAGEHPVEFSQSRNPEACAKMDFNNQALAHVAPHPSFGVLAIELDLPQHTEKSEDEALKAAARWLERVCSRENGMWSPLAARSWALFVPGQRETESLELAQRIRGRATAEKRSVTIGIAVFPTLDYPRQEILVNACKALEHARFFGPDSQVLFDAVSLNISGDTHYDAGDLQGAETEFCQALRLAPGDANLHNSLGVCQAERGDYRQALKSFETALDLKKEDPLAAYNIAMVHRLLGETDTALKFFEIAEQSQEALFEAKLQIGRIHLERDAPRQAQRFLEDASALRPGFAPAHTQLAACYETLDMEDAARTAYKKALRANANDAAALSGLGWIYHKCGENSDIATLFCRQSVEIAPENGLFRYRLARRYLQENRLEEAKKQFEEAERLGYETGGYPEIVRTRLMEKAS